MYLGMSLQQLVMREYLTYVNELFFSEFSVGVDKKLVESIELRIQQDSWHSPLPFVKLT